MKPSSKQIALAKLIEAEASGWQSSNNITSPTHYCDIRTEVGNFALFNNIDDATADKIEEALSALFTLVRNLK